MQGARRVLATLGIEECGHLGYPRRDMDLLQSQHPRCHLQLERGVWRREAQPRHGGRPLGRGPVARDEHKPQRREIREMEAKREKVPCVCRQFAV